MTDREGDPDIERRYAELPREEPPRALDEEILGAARREAEARPAPLVAPTARRHWYVPLAAAAVVVLSVVVTLQVQREQLDADMSAPSVPAPSDKGARPAVSGTAAEPKVQTRERRAVERPRPPAEPRPEPPAASAPQAVPAKPFPGEAESAGKVAAPVGRAAPIPEPASGVRQTLERKEAAAPAADALSKRVESIEPPERWLERIAALRRDGRHKEADEAYAEFRRRYPEYRIPESLRDKVLPP